MNKTNEIEAIDVSARDLAAVLGLSDRQVRNLAAEGVVVPVTRGRYRLAESARRYIASQRRPDAVTELDRRIAESRLRSLQMQNAAREGKLIPYQEAEALMAETLGVVLAGLSSLPARIAGAANQKERRRIEDIIDAARLEWVEVIGKLRAERGTV